MKKILKTTNSTNTVRILPLSDTKSATTYPDIRLSEIFRKKRQELKLSQKKLAELSGCSDLTIMDIETGKRIPRELTIRQIAEILGFSNPEIEKYLELARKSRKNREGLQMEYAIKSAEKQLGINRKKK